MNVPRNQMPQVPEEDIAKLIVFMSKGGFGVLAAGTGLPQNFRRHQDIDWKRAREMSASAMGKPILVTRLNEVIDGNHRLALHELRHTLVPYIQFDCSFVDALDMLTIFPFAYEDLEKEVLK